MGRLLTRHVERIPIVVGVKKNDLMMVEYGGDRKQGQGCVGVVGAWDKRHKQGRVKAHEALCILNKQGSKANP